MTAFRQGVSAAKTPHGMVLLDERRGRYWQVNETGAAIAAHVLAGRSLDVAVDALLADHPADTDRVRADAAAFVTALRNAGLLAP
ncbi:lasso peptide biosynthesis PqqD family chaperone [Actinokineospora bangkokensis]|uniref:Lasso peptide biosynthesis PqqD family chaperone n=1 Tax=Actinokineospora bangkokensis TaxID=1193682 RepID=A0A1Q9LLD3_9PSEU|nr:lasso peptide biosynthesis PqqD family chaperone [Actinokineospora bangkokensis]OLR92809.1 hypothetical protein BJP25_19460 [Actinokineospora bangkokensis]